MKHDHQEQAKKQSEVLVDNFFGFPKSSKSFFIIGLVLSYFTFAGCLNSEPDYVGNFGNGLNTLTPGIPGLKLHKDKSLKENQYYVYWVITFIGNDHGIVTIYKDGDVVSLAGSMSDNNTPITGIYNSKEGYWSITSAPYIIGPVKLYKNEK